jgi:hypothetical protein
MTLKELFAVTRTKPDGRTGLGPMVIIMVFAICIGLGLYVTNVFKWKPRPEKGVTLVTPRSDAVRNGGKPIEQPLVYRTALEDDPSLNISRQSLESTFRQAALTNETKAAETNLLKGWIPVVHPDLPADIHNGTGMLTTDPMVTHQQGNSGVQAPNAEVKFYYADRLLVIAPPTAAEEVTNKSGFVTRHFLPRGYKIPIILLNQINTTIGTMPVEMAIAKNVEFNGKLQIPFGWKLFGTASAGSNHKVHCTANMILDPIGREYPITGIVLDLKQEPGFDGYPTESPLLLEVLPLFQTTVSTFMGAAKDVVNQPTLIPGGILGGSNLVANTQTYELNAKNQMLDGAATVLTGMLDKKVTELTKRYPEGDIVPRGTLGFILVTQPLDMNLGTVAGSAKFLSKEEATPTPHVVTINDQQQYTPRNMSNQGMQGMQGMPGMPGPGNYQALQIPGIPPANNFNQPQNPKGLE